MIGWLLDRFILGLKIKGEKKEKHDDNERERERFYLLGARKGNIALLIMIFFFFIIDFLCELCGQTEIFL